MLFQQQILSSELRLAAATTEFKQALFRIIEQERAYLEHWMEWPKRINTVDRCARYLREMQLMNQNGQQFFCFIFFREQLAGSIALSKIDQQNRVAELGFWKSKTSLPPLQMQLSMQQFIRTCWQNSPIRRLEIQTPATNLPAKALSEKLGFTLEGSKRKALYTGDQFINLDIYGLLKEEIKTR